MLALDFKYDGCTLSEFGFIICDFNSATGSNTVDVGSKIDFKLVSTNHGKNNVLTSANFSGTIKATFDICKNPEQYDQSDMYITSKEYRNIARWLNRHEFLPLIFLYQDKDEIREPCYYNASFNLSKILVGGRMVGIQLNMETDKPFGYGEKLSVNIDTDDTIIEYDLYGSPISYTTTLYDVSDDVGLLCPDVILTCKQDGDYTIKNNSIGTTTFIANCRQGEVITMHGQTKIIETSLSSHYIASDFNYSFLQIGNNYSDNRNRITISAPCSLTISYAPIIKDCI